MGREFQKYMNSQLENALDLEGYHFHRQVDYSGKLRELEDYKVALDQTSIVAITDPHGIITYVNDKFCEISKFTREEIIGNTHRIVNSGHHSKKFFRNMWETIKQGEIWEGELRNKAKDGSCYWVKETIIPFVDQKGIPYQYMAIRHDITKQKIIEEEIYYNAYHDELTGLPNRRSFNKTIDQLMRENGDAIELTFLFLDLNHFKYINDTLGHSFGDKLLANVSQRLSDYLPAKENLFRFGGDEFIIVLKDTSIEEVRVLARSIGNLFSKPFYLNGETLYLSASIGASFYPSDGRDIETLVIKADSAMYSSKKRGTTDIQFYSNEVYEDITKQMELEKELRQAVNEKSFTLHYQPQFDLNTKQVIGMEALIRWVHPDLGNIPPLDFIPIAEEVGLILPITEWVLETACAQNFQWQCKGLSPIKMGVNISAKLFRKELITMVEQILRKTGLEPCYLELEITESTMQDPEITIPILKEIKALGVQISLDDFGTGYSSLSYLRHFPIDSLKIDRSFISDINKDNGIIVKTIMDMARHFGFKVIAEGIEHIDHLIFLLRLNCNEGQGYLFSPPITNEQAISFLLERAKIAN